MLEEGTTYRFRYIAPAIAEEGVDFLAVAGDMEALCTTQALPYLARQGHDAERVVITLMQEPVDFGVMSPGVTQFFESYEVREGRCIWEAF
ncbi:hypothetical protein AVJ23_05535 [Pseudoponticoccus marisrubri]|uniref:Uncharacterized protein n=1 Tax=Pseudoponticoccus marisrubri TaxID=1685382 RepID=A0A0W7WN63_9RHOB|nr:hypothetical protein AVJ23_05535 [Pseudoponticoccus marisrubri]